MNTIMYYVYCITLYSYICKSMYNHLLVLWDAQSHLPQVETQII